MGSRYTGAIIYTLLTPNIHSLGQARVPADVVQTHFKAILTSGVSSKQLSAKQEEKAGREQPTRPCIQQQTGGEHPARMLVNNARLCPPLTSLPKGPQSARLGDAGGIFSRHRRAERWHQSPDLDRAC